LTPEPSPGRRRLVAGHQALALLLLNTAIVLLAINVLAAILLAGYRRYLAPAPGPLDFGLEKLSLVYPGWSEDEIEALLTETWSHDYVYSPFVQHREERRSGRYVNVDRHGFRHSQDQGPWPPDDTALNVFVFGGSTTFGYGVADRETIGRYFNNRLKDVFAGVAEPGVLRNSLNNPLYFLCFAVGTERGKDIALRIARHLLKELR